MTLIRLTFRRGRALAPLMSIGLVLLVPFWLQHDSIAAKEHLARDVEVVEAVETAPYRMGRWIGTDVPLHDVAGQQLNPTAALSRRFVHMDTGHIVEVTIIHSGDARDMLGHHPPVCYPSNGWTALNEPTWPRRGSRGDKVALDVAGLAVTSQRYEFTRTSNSAGRAHIRVFNFFVLPDGLVTPSISDVHRQTSWLRATSPGVAQVQVLTHIDFPESAAQAAAGEILGGFKRVFQAVGVDFDATSQRH